MLACNRCFHKRGSHSTGPTPLDKLPVCPLKALEHTVLATDTIQLECLAWAVFDNIMGPGKRPPLSGFETYNQIIWRLMGKAYKGLYTHCPARTSASFDVEVVKPRLRNPDSRRNDKPQRYTMTRDVRKEFSGSYSTMKEGQDVAGKYQSFRPTPTVNPNTQGMKWMKECQRSYHDAQIDFWLLLRPLTDGSEESTRHLAHRLLSVWHWSPAIDPPTYPPVPTSMNIGYWLSESEEEDE